MSHDDLGLRGRLDLKEQPLDRARELSIVSHQVVSQDFVTYHIS